MRSNHLVKVLAFLTICFCVTANKFEAGCATETGQVPIQVIDGYLVVAEASVAERRGLKFLLDTGSTQTTIDRRLADALNLPRGTGKVMNLDKTIMTYRTVLPSFALGPRVTMNLPVNIGDLSYLRANGVRVDGVVGLDVLARGSFTLDFANKVLVPGCDDTPSHVVPMDADGLALYVSMELDGRSVKMIVDSGARGVVLYEGRLMNLNTDYRVLNTGMGRTFSGSVDGKIVLLPRLRLGNQDLDRRAYLLQDPGSDQLRGVAGNLGLGALGAKKISFDFEHMELRWTTK